MLAARQSRVPACICISIMTEVVLAYLHLIAILTMTVFLSAEVALCRPAWMNAAVVQRLARVDLIYMGSALTVLATGLARFALGAKGWEWYVHNPLFHVKVTLFVVMLVLSVRPSITLARWRRMQAGTGVLPPAPEVDATRRRMFWTAHLMLVLPLLGVLLARGY